MGALRAAELHAVGMVGVGWVFEAFASGALEDDDEVAVIHAPARLGYAPVSEAMVNLRRTIDRAVAEQLLSLEEAEALIDIAKGYFYADREWPRLLAEARTIVPADVLGRLKAWLPSGRIDIKSADALALAKVINVAATPASDKPVHYEHTMLVETVRRAALRGRSSRAAGQDYTSQIRRWRHKEPSGYAYELLALIDALLFEREQRESSTPDGAALVQTAHLWRETLGLGDGDAVDNWLAEHGVGEAQLMSLLVRDTRLLQARDALRPLTDRCLVERLALSHDGLDLRTALPDGEEGCSALDWYRPGDRLTCKKPLAAVLEAVARHRHCAGQRAFVRPARSR